MSASERIVERIRREGPIPYDGFVEIALYGDDGFFTRARGAGRAGRDFVTSPEVGPLFGALVARALDGWWRELDAPDPFLVVEVGAGRGRLARDVLAAEPECERALRYVLVERSPALRAAQHELLRVEPFEDALGPVVRTDDDAPLPVTGMGPIVTALDELPAVALDGVVLANELLDNLPFRIVERTADGWAEVLVALDGDQLVETVVPALAELAAEADAVAADAAVPVGTRLPVPTRITDWLHSCAAALRHGVLVVVDYVASARGAGRRAAPTAGCAPTGGTGGAAHRSSRPAIRTSRSTCPRSTSCTPRAAPASSSPPTSPRPSGSRRSASKRSSTVARATWEARAHVGDLEAVRQRSRVTEAAALVDPAGLGAHRVLVFTR